MMAKFKRVPNKRKDNAGGSRVPKVLKERHDKFQYAELRRIVPVKLNHIAPVGIPQYVWDDAMYAFQLEDIRAAFIILRTLCRNSPTLVITSECMEWCKRNHEVVRRIVEGK